MAHVTYMVLLLWSDPVRCGCNQPHCT